MRGAELIIFKHRKIDMKHSFAQHQTHAVALGMARHAWLFGLALLLVTATNIQAAETTAPVANFTSVSGSVDTIRQQVDSPISAKIGMGSFSSDTVSTKHHSRTQLTFIDGSKLNMGQDYQMAIKDFQYDDINKTRKAVLKVVSGVVHVDVAKLGSRTTDFTVETPSAVISVRGTAFFVTVVDGKTFVSVTEGTVQVSNSAGQTVSVAAGQTVEVTANMLTQAFSTPTDVNDMLTKSVTDGAPFPVTSDLVSSLSNVAKNVPQVPQSVPAVAEAAKQAGGFTISSGGVTLGAAAIAAALTLKSGGSVGTTIGTVGTR